MLKKKKEIIMKKNTKTLRKETEQAKNKETKDNKKQQHKNTSITKKQQQQHFFETYITYLLVECNLMGIRMYFQVTKQLKLFFSSCISLSLILTVSILLTSFIV